MNSATQHSIEAGLAAAGSKATYTGPGVVLSGWLFSNEFAIFIGVVIGVAGFLVNWYYRHKLTSIEIKTKLDELQLRQEQNERDKAEHAARMKTFHSRKDDHALCRHEEGICLHNERI